MINVALCGKMRSGKDTVGKYLIEHYGFTRYAFGDGIRDVCNKLFSDQMNDAKPRALLQGVGQALRQFDNNVWVNLTLSNIDSCRAMEMIDNVVITDLRQPNEYERLKSEGYIFIRVNCSDEIRKQRMEEAGDSFTDVHLKHETEQHVDLFPVNYSVFNTGGFTGLYHQVDVIMRDITGKKNRIDDSLYALQEREAQLMQLVETFKNSVYLQEELAKVRKAIRTLTQ